MKRLLPTLLGAVTLAAADHPLAGHKLLVTSFRFTDEACWRNKERMQEVYSRKPADKRPVWFVRPDGSDAQVLEPLRYQMSIDGSRASWKPWISKGMGTRE